MLKKKLVPDLTPDSLKILHHYFGTSKVYFEFGSGGSTYEAFQIPHLKIYSVESDLEWINKIYECGISKNDDRLKIMYVDIKSKPISYGYPGLNSTYDDWIKYSRSFSTLDEITKKSVDLVLIDGRFRVACALNIFNEIRDDTIVLFDDFLNRDYYHVVKNYYDIIDSADNRLAVLKKKDKINGPEKELIKEYESDAR